MKIIAASLAAGLLLATIDQANAQTTMGELVDAMHVDPNTATDEQLTRQISTYAYVRGMIDMLPFLTEHGIKVTPCLPKDGIAAGDAILILMRWAQANKVGPEWTVRVALLGALRDTFPCKSQSQKRRK